MYYVHSIYYTLLYIQIICSCNTGSFCVVDCFMVSPPKSTTLGILKAKKKIFIASHPVTAWEICPNQAFKSFVFYV